MNYSPSCDTLAIPGEYTLSGNNILAKNSDREVTESQQLVFIPAGDHREDEKEQCTYIKIKQVPHTYAVIGSKPWWIWGFEMGINEWGVSIGNEAEWANVQVKDEDALLGMDLVRLGLQRSRTAFEALKVITDLLETYGQGGSCKYGTSRSESSYHNTFVIADPEEIYLLETVREHWVYKKIDDVTAVSNIYTIGRDYDGMSKDIEMFAQSKGLQNPDQTFDFAKSFMLLNYHFMGGFYRTRWAGKMLREKKGSLDAENVLDILRGHYEGTFIENNWSAVGGCVPCVCMHGSAPTFTQTAASMVVEYHRTPYKELLFTYWGSLCPPCCSFIIPFYNTGYIPEIVGRGKNYYEEDSLWWKINRMVSDIESNYERYHLMLDEVRPSVEHRFREMAAEAEKEAEDLLRAGKNDEACGLLNGLTDKCLDEVTDLVNGLTKKIEEDMKQHSGEIYRASYLSSYRKKVKYPD